MPNYYANGSYIFPGPPSQSGSRNNSQRLKNLSDDNEEKNMPDFLIKVEKQGKESEYYMMRNIGPTGNEFAYAVSRLDAYFRAVAAGHWVRRDKLKYEQENNYIDGDFYIKKFIEGDLDGDLAKIEPCVYRSAVIFNHGDHTTDIDELTSDDMEIYWRQKKEIFTGTLQDATPQGQTTGDDNNSNDSDNNEEEGWQIVAQNIAHVINKHYNNTKDAYDKTTADEFLFLIGEKVNLKLKN